MATKKEEKKKCECMKDKTEEQIKAERLENKAKVYARTIAQLVETSAKVHELWLSTHEDASAEEKHGQLVAAIQSAIMIALMNI